MSEGKKKKKKLNWAESLKNERTGRRVSDEKEAESVEVKYSRREECERDEQSMAIDKSSKVKSDFNKIISSILNVRLGLVTIVVNATSTILKMK